jgi:hypothetical protein
MEIANVGGEFLFRASVWAVRHSENGIDGFDAGLKDFFGYTIHVILGFLVDVLRGTKVLDFGIDFYGGKSKQSKATKAKQSRDRSRE